MARNDNRNSGLHSAERAHAPSWRALANATVASTLVAALLVGALALTEAVFSGPASRLASNRQAASRDANRLPLMRPLEALDTTPVCAVCD